MQNNSNDNIPSWRQRLDQFEETTQPVEQELRWEQFQQKQLQAPTPAKKRGIYWLAAAAVISMIFCCVYFLSNQSVKEMVQPTSVKSTTVPATMTENMVEITTLPITNTHTQPAIVVKPSRQQKVFLLKKDSAMLLPVEAPVMTVNIRPATIDNQPASTQVMTEIKPKKLKLLHLNELNYPGSSADLAAQEGKPYFPVNTPTRKVYGKSNVEPTSKDKDNLIRIKLFP
jgi:hypothetical protein